MSWSVFYPLCFVVGFLFSVLSFLGGATHIHLPARFHWPFHFGHHAGGMAGRGTMHAPGGLSWFNALTIMTFLSWFGGGRSFFSPQFPRLGGGGVWPVNFFQPLCSRVLLLIHWRDR